MQEKITIQRMSFGDAGIGTLNDGRVVFVNGSCPGDVVLASIVQDKASFAIAKIDELIEPSPHRVHPFCPFVSCCGGCGWQHISYDFQLEAKRENFISHLVKNAHMDHTRAQELVSPTRASKRQQGYRNKIELGVTRDNRGLISLGFHGQGSDKLVEITQCPLAHKQIAHIPKALQGALRYLYKNEDFGIFRIGVRHSLRTHDLEIALWTRPGAFPRNATGKILSESHKASSVVRVLSDGAHKARKIKGIEVLAGKGYWREELAGITHTISAPSFCQVNTAQADTLISLVCEGLQIDDSSVVADLYCGVGTFTLPLAQRAQLVFGVEAQASSLRNLRRSAEAYGLDTIEAIGGDATRELPTLGSLDALVVDPPRSGLTQEIIASIKTSAPQRIAYVSCDGATWARDVERLEHAGFCLTSAVPVDMFPQTYHCEMVSMFERMKV